MHFKLLSSKNILNTLADITNFVISHKPHSPTHPHFLSKLKEL